MGTEKRARQKAGRQARIQAAEIAQRKAQSRSRLIRGGALIVVVVVIFAGVLYVTRKSDTTVDTAASAPTGTTQPGTPTIVDRNGDGGGSSTTTTPGATAGPAEVPPAPAGATITGETPCPAADGSSARTTKFAKAPPMCIDAAKTYTATFDTNMGTVKMTLDAKSMPSTTNNFVVLSRYHYYDGTALFRLDPSIDIIQGGAATTNSASDPGPGYTIPDEGGKFTYKEGQIVMARTGQPNSSGAQFFLTSGPKVSALDSQGTYLLFGTVTEGLDVLKQIMATYVPFPPDSPNAQLGGGPKDPVIVNKVTITE
jgi:cyclophilin family peptidyl-prolyl cis-trans isomerase